MQGYNVPHTMRVSNLKLMRIKKGMRQTDLAAASGIPLKSIGNYEQLRRDINRARIDIVYHLASALGCKMEEILELENL